MLSLCSSDDKERESFFVNFSDKGDELIAAEEDGCPSADAWRFIYNIKHIFGLGIFINKNIIKKMATRNQPLHYIVTCINLLNDINLVKIKNVAVQKLEQSYDFLS